MPEDSDVVVSQEDAQYIIERQREEIDKLRGELTRTIALDLERLRERIRWRLEVNPWIDRAKLRATWGDPLADPDDA